MTEIALGRVVTAAGVSAGIDMALTLAGYLVGENAAGTPGTPPATPTTVTGRWRPSASGLTIP